MKPYSIALAANQALDVQVGGGLFFIDSAPQAIASVEFFGANNVKRDEQLELAVPGDWAKPVNGFGWFKLTNGAVAQTVRVYVARGEVGRFRIQGEVSVVDGNKARTISGVAFMGQAGIAGVAAQLGHVQLKNPAASQTRVVVSRLMLTAEAVTGVTIIRYDTDLGLQNNVPSKDVGAAASVAELRTLSQVAPLGTGNNLAHQYVQANSTPPPIVFAEPLVLRPGRGVIARADNLNVTIGCTFELVEEPNT